MKLVASMIVRNELGRYLPDTIPALLDVVDEIRVYDDGSTDGTVEWLRAHDRVQVAAAGTGATPWIEHEGKARQILLDWTLAAKPTHVLAIDADEFVADPRMIRARLTQDPNRNVWTLDMTEVWELDGDCICVRMDGGWRPHAVPILWRVPESMDGELWSIADRALACGREPQAVRRLMGQARPIGTRILHMGWANESERQARYDRYAVADGGKFHRNAHLESIMWPPDRVELDGIEWPDALAGRRDSITRRVHHSAGA